MTSARIAWDENRVAHIFPPVTGRVIDITAQLGDTVKKGQALATILSPDLGSAVSDMNKAKAALIAAEHDVKRQRELFALKAVSAAVLEASEDNYGVCVAEMQRAEQKAALLREAGVNSVTQTYTLYSPIDGQVLARSINPGIEVQGMYSGGATDELYTVGTVRRRSGCSRTSTSRTWPASRWAPRWRCAPSRTRTSRFTGTIDWISDTLDPVHAHGDRPLHAGRTPIASSSPRCTPRSRSRRRGGRPSPSRDPPLLHFGEKTMVIGADTQANKYERRPVIVDENETGDWVPVLHGVEAGRQDRHRGRADPVRGRQVKR